MDAKLVVVSGKAPAGEYQLKLPSVIGRSRSAAIAIGHPLISRQHCELFDADGVLMVRDLGSLNGTYIDEMRLAEEPMILPAGRRLTVGSVTFEAVYRMPESTKGGSTDSSPSAGTQIIQQTVHELPSSSDHDVRRAATAAPDENEADLNPPALPLERSFDFGWLDESPADAVVDAAAQAVEEEDEELKPTESVRKPPTERAPFKKAPTERAPAKQQRPADEPAKLKSSAGQDEEADLDDFFNNLK